MGHARGLALPGSLDLRVLIHETVSQCVTLGHVDRLLITHMAVTDFDPNCSCLDPLNPRGSTTPQLWHFIQCCQGSSQALGHGPFDTLTRDSAMSLVSS